MMCEISNGKLFESSCFFLCLLLARATLVLFLGWVLAVYLIKIATQLHALAGMQNEKKWRKKKNTEEAAAIIKGDDPVRIHFNSFFFQRQSL